MSTSARLAAAARYTEQQNRSAGQVARDTARDLTGTEHTAGSSSRLDDKLAEMDALAAEMAAMRARIASRELSALAAS